MIRRRLAPLLLLAAATPARAHALPGLLPLAYLMLAFLVVLALALVIGAAYDAYARRDQPQRFKFWHFAALMLILAVPFIWKLLEDQGRI